MKKLLFLLLLVSSFSSAAVSERAIEKLPKGTMVKLIFNNGTVVAGTFESYVPYDESVFILPWGKSGLFADDAYSLREIKTIRIIVLK